MSEPLTIEQRAENCRNEIIWESTQKVDAIIARHMREAIADAIHREGHYWTCPECGGHFFGRPTIEVDGVKQIDMTRIKCHGASSEGPFFCGKIFPDVRKQEPTQ